MTIYNAPNRRSAVIRLILMIIGGLVVLGLIIGLVVSYTSANTANYTIQEVRAELANLQKQATAVAAAQAAQAAQPTPASQPTIAPQQPSAGGAQPQPTQQVYATGQTQIGSGNQVYLTVMNPAGGEQTQVRHPVAYHQTNVVNSATTYILDIPTGYNGIVGGVVVNGQANGVYLGLGPGHHQYDITNGFAEIIRANWARDQFAFRVGQAAEFGWAHAVENPGPIQ